MPYHNDGKSDSARTVQKEADWNTFIELREKFKGLQPNLPSSSKIAQNALNDYLNEKFTALNALLLNEEKIQIQFSSEIERTKIILLLKKSYEEKKRIITLAQKLNKLNNEKLNSRFNALIANELNSKRQHFDERHKIELNNSENEFSRLDKLANSKLEKQLAVDAKKSKKLSTTSSQPYTINQHDANSGLYSDTPLEVDAAYPTSSKSEKPTINTKDDASEKHLDEALSASNSHDTIILSSQIITNEDELISDLTKDTVKKHDESTTSKAQSTNAENDADKMFFNEALSTLSANETSTLSSQIIINDDKLISDLAAEQLHVNAENDALTNSKTNSKEGISTIEQNKNQVEEYSFTHITTSFKAAKEQLDKAISRLDDENIDIENGLNLISEVKESMKQLNTCIMQLEHCTNGDKDKIENLSKEIHDIANNESILPSICNKISTIIKYENDKISTLLNEQQTLDIKNEPQKIINNIKNSNA